MIASHIFIPMTKKILYSIFFLFSFVNLFADEEFKWDKGENNPPAYDPWYTGPLLAGSARTVPQGMINIQPYVFVTNNFGLFDSTWRYHHFEETNVAVNPLFILQYGLTPWMDATATVQMIYCHYEGNSSFNMGDTVAKLGFQLLKDKKGEFQPDVKPYIGMNFPTGKYTELSPDNYICQASGSGSFEIKTGVNFQKLIPDFKVFPWSYNPYRFRLCFDYTIPMPVQVRNFNTYGGGFGTEGQVRPGNIFTCIGAFEFSFTQHWVLAWDLQYADVQKTKFNGHVGRSADGSPASMGKGSSAQFSMAPGLEYNVNDSLGFIAGIWFSLWSRNIDDFTSFIGSFTWSF